MYFEEFAFNSYQIDSHFLILLDIINQSIEFVFPHQIKYKQINKNNQIHFYDCFQKYYFQQKFLNTLDRFIIQSNHTLFQPNFQIFKKTQKTKKHDFPHSHIQIHSFKNVTFKQKQKIKRKHQKFAQTKIIQIFLLKIFLFACLLNSFLLLSFSNIFYNQKLKTQFYLFSKIQTMLSVCQSANLFDELEKKEDHLTFNKLVWLHNSILQFQIN
ncbi:transmembrane protein, putative (macronuclear) [Tetrahymena thermophila SB210]|uniref:Transmembrane protein, putative n=1 Tax=Tetrahymena thermophila (strain SB210) TaxID=312017 RepID=W7XFT6_TETTS|nr:transmembrane protein, putative [Tetrahymena thermophila SB210]EWS75733.1 transmembrane protein, putative [Tetrahymena thermophila SB210]|eukprot:XP_012651655.1 transmembrane protein, putative [Tetrahymena thermophila SB210]